MRIVVLEGGLSPERDVSKTSARLIANALLSRGHEVCVVDLYEGIEDDSDLDSLFRTGNSDPYTYTILETEPDLEAVIACHGGRRQWLGPRVIDICKTADTVFLGLHGAHGENGQVQALLDAYGIKYTGCDYMGCALAMDKDVSKMLVQGAGLRTAKWVTRPSDQIDFDSINKEIGMPCVIKPIGCGSSCGVSIVSTKEEFEKAISYANQYKQDILIEQFIKGREMTVGIVGDHVLPVIEIIPHEGFYDYKNKYQAGLTTHICPANLTKEQTQAAKDFAYSIFKILRMSSYGRIDIFFDEENDCFWFIEANNLPGMTNTSLVPDAAAVDGINYEELCERIAKESINR